MKLFLPLLLTFALLLLLSCTPCQGVVENVYNAHVGDAGEAPVSPFQCELCGRCRNTLWSSLVVTMPPGTPWPLIQCPLEGCNYALAPRESIAEAAALTFVLTCNSPEGREYGGKTRQRMRKANTPTKWGNNGHSSLWQLAYMG